MSIKSISIICKNKYKTNPLVFFLWVVETDFYHFQDSFFWFALKSIWYQFMHSPAFLYSNRIAETDLLSSCSSKTFMTTC